MPRKRYRPEEIVVKLRQVDVLVSQRSEYGGCDPPDWRERGDILYLWTALPVQVDFELSCLASCKHLSGVTRQGRGAQMGNPLAQASIDRTSLLENL